jgi:hypothetical protein
MVQRMMAEVAALLPVNLVDGTWAPFRQVLSCERGIDENSIAWR